MLNRVGIPLHLGKMAISSPSRPCFSNVFVFCCWEPQNLVEKVTTSKLVRNAVQPLEGSTGTLKGINQQSHFWVYIQTKLYDLDACTPMSICSNQDMVAA